MVLKVLQVWNGNRFVTGSWFRPWLCYRLLFVERDKAFAGDNRSYGFRPYGFEMVILALLVLQVL